MQPNLSNFKDIVTQSFVGLRLEDKATRSTVHPYWEIERSNLPIPLHRGGVNHVQIEKKKKNGLHKNFDWHQATNADFTQGRI